jgi:hypothetical protein
MRYSWKYNHHFIDIFIQNILYYFIVSLQRTSI